eukprot:6317353-Prymnesium_polylepis.1
MHDRERAHVPLHALIEPVDGHGDRLVGWQRVGICRTCRMGVYDALATALAHARKTWPARSAVGPRRGPIRFCADSARVKSACGAPVSVCRCEKTTSSSEMPSVVMRHSASAARPVTHAIQLAHSSAVSPHADAE